jgi:anti-anti-sigma regulatory factor
MLKITQIADGPGLTTLRVEGRLVGPWVKELHRECERLLRDGSRLVLELSELRFLDESAITLLRSLEGRRVTLARPLPFVAEALRGEAHGALR